MKQSLNIRENRLRQIIVTIYLNTAPIPPPINIERKFITMITIYQKHKRINSETLRKLLVTELESSLSIQKNKNSCWEIGTNYATDLQVK